MGFPRSAVDPEIGPQSAESGHPTRAGAISILTQAGKAPPNRIRHLHHPPGRKKRHTISFSKFVIKPQNIQQL